MTTEERLEKVEQELKETKAGLAAAQRRNRWTMGCGAVLILGCLTIAATPGGNRTIRANKFILEDENGKPRAALTVDYGYPRLAMMDKNNKLRVEMSVDMNGYPRLSMYNENDKPRVEMKVDKNESMLLIENENGKVRAQLTVDRNGRPGLVMVDENGKPRALMAVDKAGPVLSMEDENENLRAMLGVGKDGPRLATFDANNKLIWKAP